MRTLALALLLLSGAPAAEPPAELVVPVELPAAQGNPTAAECVARFGPVVPVCAVAFSPDGRTLAAGGYQEVLLWDLAEAKLVKRLGVGRVGDLVHALAFCHEGRDLAVAEGTPGERGAVQLIDVAADRTIATFGESRDDIHAVAFSPDETLLATGGADSEIRVWTVADQKLVATMSGHTGWIHALAFSADGKQLASASADRTARTWQVADGKQLLFVPEEDSVNGVAWSPDGKQLGIAVGGLTEHTIRYRNAETGAQTGVIDIGVAAPVGMLWDAKGNRAFVPCTDRCIKLVTPQPWGQGITQWFVGHSDWVYCLALHPAGNRLASGGADGTVRLWNPVDGKPIAVLTQLAPRTDRYLIVTAQGYAATSSPEVPTWRAGAPLPADTKTRMLDVEQVKKLLAGPAVEVAGGAQ